MRSTGSMPKRTPRGMIYRARNDATRRPSSAGNIWRTGFVSRAFHATAFNSAVEITFATLMLIGCAGPVK